MFPTPSGQPQFAKLNMLEQQHSNFLKYLFYFYCCVYVSVSMCYVCVSALRGPLSYRKL